MPITKDLVLVGGGHTHALLLRRWGMRPLAGARLTVVNPGPTAPYTGMLPGHIAGHYSEDDLSIDLIKLCRFAGARIISGAVTSLDPQARQLHMPDRPPIAYDIASINVGITSNLPDLPGFQEHGVGAKPLGRFATKWREFLLSDQPREIAVIGGGVGGVELALAMAHACKGSAKVTLIERAALLPGISDAARDTILRKLRDYDVTWEEGKEVAKVTDRAVYLSDGAAIPARFVVGAAGATPHEWLSQIGLAHQAGFLSVDENLRTSDPNIYAAGDCAALPAPRPKAGVFAVREAPILYHNLRVALSDRGQFRPFKPQKRYLKLISLGAKSAVADRRGGGLHGPWVWRWKDWIDRRFMNKLTKLPEMTAVSLPRERTADLAEALGPKPMCGGCGAKVGQDALSASIGGLASGARSDVTHLPGDDAAILTNGGSQIVITTDHLRSVTEDPWLMGKIAANHALGDIWAMGAVPQAALATVILPRLSENLQRRWLDEIMQGAQEVIHAAGAEIVGGHTSQGTEMTIGFSLTGLMDRPAITLAGARPGDCLILTKPIGSGTILAAEMQMKARGNWVLGCLDLMVQPQGEAAKCLAEAHAMTDVTGFGLAGHLMNICEASGVGAELNVGSIPVMEDALELARQGVRSSLFAQNAATRAKMTAVSSAQTDLLFDPQTSGGLLAAMPAEMAADAITTLRKAGYHAALIGQIIQGPAHIIAHAP
ncbi:selenide, water dikinase SelD [Candidatus Rhodobacter oscarellae]|nr:selenide, water dikinase SelD [Candidatus Rhodobacter lobularis]